MLEKPALDDAKIAACLRSAYAIDAADLAFLPLGADRDTAVYRATAHDGRSYFVKLRRGPFDDLPILVPWFLHQRGVRQVIPPLPTHSDGLWTRLDEFTLAVFLFVAGVDGYERDLLDPQWIELGRAFKAIHALDLPADLRDHIPRETYSAAWRERVRGYLALAAEQRFSDPVAADLAGVLRREQPVIEALLRRADALASLLSLRSLPYVLCHADIHAGNVLLDASGALHIVDWDTAALAPKERDLMFPGGGLFGGWRSPEDEEALFYRGYGTAKIDRNALAYYRCERIVQDVAAYCEQILLTDAGGEDRPNGLRQFTGQFRPGAVVAIALRTPPEPPITRRRVSSTRARPIRRG